MTFWKRGIEAMQEESHCLMCLKILDELPVIQKVELMDVEVDFV
ncbi:MAG: hypothetical protein WCP08_00895 [Prolixibacteraceae bacterium]